MKLGGKCPLNHLKNQERFMRVQLENFLHEPVTVDVEKMRKEFCKKICDNIMC